ncbi:MULTISPECIES: hypothetical protein [Streptomyces]|uniref:hypothetical protein n=1 Tax=Streptomyces TaxID=1883 RepID=UPI00345BBC23
MSTLITYRQGVWLVDTRRSRVGQVTGHDDCHVRLRPPRGGREWDAEPAALRLATRPERAAAGVADQESAADSRRIFRVGPYLVQEKQGEPC